MRVDHKIKLQNEKYWIFTNPIRFLTCPRTCRSPSTSVWTWSVWWRWNGPRSGWTSGWCTAWCCLTEWAFLRWCGKCGRPPRGPRRPRVLQMGSAWCYMGRSENLIRITPRTRRSNFSQLGLCICCNEENEPKTTGVQSSLDNPWTWWNFYPCLLLAGQIMAHFFAIRGGLTVYLA